MPLATEVRYTFAKEDIRRIIAMVREQERGAKHGGGGGFTRGNVQMIRHAKTSASTAHAWGTTGTVTLYTDMTVSAPGATGSVSGTAGIQVTANNMYGDVPVATWVTVAHDGQCWTIIAAYCQ